MYSRILASLIGGQRRPGATDRAGPCL